MFQIHFWKGKNWRSSLRVSSLLLPLQTVKVTSQQVLLQCPTCSNTVSLHSLFVRRFQPIHLSYTLHRNERDNLCFYLFNFLAPRIWASYLFACFCDTKSKRGRNICRVEWCCWDKFLPKESIYAFSMLFFSVPLVKILLPQFTRSTAHWKHAWANAKTEFPTERGTGGSNQGSRLTYEAKSKIHYRIGKISIYKDPEKREIISLSGSWK